MRIARVFAILFVIMAHSRNENYLVISTITERLGAIGVPVFFIMSGYFFNIKKYGVKAFWKKRITSILIPWFFTGSVMYTITMIHEISNFKILGLINFILGNGSYLWYLLVLIVCYLIFGLIDKKWFCITFVVLNVISLVLTSFGLIAPPNPYLNVLNWSGFFAVGLLLKDHMEGMLSLIKRKALLIIPSYILLLGLGVLIEPNAGGYFSKLALPMELTGIAVVLTFASMKIFDFTLMYKASGLAFSVYLTHFMIFPITRILPQNQIFEFINPLIILVVNVGLLYLGGIIAKYLKLSKLYSILLGTRDER